MDKSFYTRKKYEIRLELGSEEMGSVTQGPGDTQSQSLTSDLGIRDMPLKLRDCHLPKKCFVLLVLMVLK